MSYLGICCISPAADGSFSVVHVARDGLCFSRQLRLEGMPLLLLPSTGKPRFDGCCLLLWLRGLQALGLLILMALALPGKIRFLPGLC